MVGEGEKEGNRASEIEDGTYGEVRICYDSRHISLVHHLSIHHRQKIEAYRISREILKNIQKDVDSWLRENQYVGSDARSEVALDFMPWLSSQVSDRVSKVEESSKLLDHVLTQSLEKAYELFDNRKCWIRVLVKRRDSIEDEDNDDEEHETNKRNAPVGPIGVGPSDTVRDVLNAFESEMTQQSQDDAEFQKM